MQDLVKLIFIERVNEAAGLSMRLSPSRCTLLIIFPSCLSHRCYPSWLALTTTIIVRLLFGHSIKNGFTCPIVLFLKHYSIIRLCVCEYFYSIENIRYRATSFISLCIFAIAIVVITFNFVSNLFYHLIKYNSVISIDNLIQQKSYIKINFLYIYLYFLLLLILQFTYFYCFLDSVKIILYIHT